MHKKVRGKRGKWAEIRVETALVVAKSFVSRSCSKFLGHAPGAEMATCPIDGLDLSTGYQ